MVTAQILDGYFQKDSGWLFSKIKLIKEINSAYFIHVWEPLTKDHNR